MNRLGLRLAAGLVVISIGGLAVFQAKRSSDTVVDQSWADDDVPAAVEPPVPLELESGSAAAAFEDPDLLVRANNGAATDQAGAASGPSTGFGLSTSASVDGTVQLASHDEPAAGPASGFAFPQPLDASQPEAPQAAVLQTEAGLADGAAADSEFQPAASTDLQPLEPLPSDSAAGSAASADAPMTTLDMPAMGATELAMPELAPIGAAPAAANQPNDASSASAFGFPQPLGSDSSPEAEATGAAETTVSEEQPAPQAAEANATLGADFDMQPVDMQPVDMQPVDMEPADESPTDLAPAETAPAGSALQMPSASSTTAATELSTDIADRAAASEAELAPLDSFGRGPRTGAAAATAAPRADASLQTIDASEVLAEPGERRLEGAQTPSVVIHKRAPEEVRVGKPADFVIQVKNVGTVPALDVRVFDSVPEGMKLVEVVPQAAELAGLLCWQLGDLEPGGERTVSMTLIPQTEGELGSVARVTFEAAASVRTIATRPELKLVQRAPEQVLIGQQVEIEVELSNVGSGSATGVVLQADLPEGLQHPMGRQLDNLIGVMPPGDMRRQILRLQATAAGTVQNTIRLMGEDGVETESTVNIEVVSPSLQVALSGPSLRYLERQTTYNVQVANSGTANASEIDIVAYLDRGLKFVSTDFEGQYDPNRHAVFWSLAELPAGQSGEVPLTLLPVEAGKHSVRLEAKADLGIAAASEKELAIETLAELSFSIADDQDPIETGTETTYEIRVQNTGSRDDSNVQLKVQLPPGMQLVSADPQAGTDGRGLVVFQPIARVPAKAEQVFRVRVSGTSPDTHVIKAIVVSDQSQKPVTKEESTTVYSDQ